MDNILWLDNPLHRNSFPKEVLGEEGVLDSLVVTFEGTIMGVDKDAIDSYFNSDESKIVKFRSTFFVIGIRNGPILYGPEIIPPIEGWGASIFSSQTKVVSWKVSEWPKMFISPALIESEKLSLGLTTILDSSFLNE